MKISSQKMQAKRAAKPKQIETPPPSALQRKSSSGSITFSKTRLVMNNRHLAIQLNNKKIAMRCLRERFQKLSRTFEASKRAFKNLAIKYNNSVTLLKKMQQMAPKVQQDICKAMSKYEKVCSSVEEFDLENLENLSFLDNLDLTDDMTFRPKLKPFCRKRATVQRVRPMKFGLVLGNPVVSLHRLQAPSGALRSIDEFASESDEDTQDEPVTVESVPQARRDSGRPMRPHSAINSAARISPSQIAELTLSVPLLQPLNSSGSSATSSPAKRMRLDHSGPSSDRKCSESPRQLTTPCRVVVEHLSEDDYRMCGTPVLSTSRPGLPPFQSTPANGMNNHVVNGSANEGRLKKKLTDKELIRALTPMQVKIHLVPLKLDSANSTAKAAVQNRKPRKASRGISNCFDYGSSGEETVKAAIPRESQASDDDALTLPVKKKPAKRLSDQNRLTVKLWGNKSFSKKSCSEEQEELKLPEAESFVTKRRGKRNANTVQSNKNLNTSDSSYNEIDNEEHPLTDEVSVINIQIDQTPSENAVEEVIQPEKTCLVSGSSSNKLPTSKSKLQIACPKSKKTGNTAEKLTKALLPEVEEKQCSEVSSNGIITNGPRVPAGNSVPKPNFHKPCPKSKKVVNPGAMKSKIIQAEEKNQQTGDTAGSSSDKGKAPESVEDQPMSNPKVINAKSKRALALEAKKAQAAAPKEVDKPLASNVAGVPKRCKPMPLSKKRLLGIVVSDDLIIDAEIEISPRSVIKQEPNENDASNRTDYMKKFYQRVSLEDPLEGTSRQHVYKLTPPPDMEKKRSLRYHNESINYTESPPTDVSGDDETWYPREKARCGKK